ncbi:MAG: hypothetical protein FGM14_03675 [Flavobacteriales bacterium]|nr:hypothetical protein [Flavobacteriales bacterium]
MNYKNIEQEIIALNKEMEARMNEPENQRFIIDDGVMKPDVYFSKSIRLAWMLKEPYDSEDGTGGGWSYFDMFPEGKDLYLEQFRHGHKSTWHPMIYISYSIHNNFPKWEDMKYIREDHSMCDVVRHVAFINAQKLPSKGFTNTDFEDLWESIEKHSDLLKKQIDLLNPSVFIFGNTIGLYKKIFDLDFSKFQTHGSSKFIEKDGRLYISAYHPSQRIVTRDAYINDIIEIVSRWSKNQ